MENDKPICEHKTIFQLLLTTGLIFLHDFFLELWRTKNPIVKIWSDSNKKEKNRRQTITNFEFSTSNQTTKNQTKTEITPKCTNNKKERECVDNDVNI